MFRLPEPGRVGLYDLGGRLLLREGIDAGSRVWTLPHALLPNGTYLIRLETPSRETQRRLVVVR
ncbi:T9SS type A sorting domain-containing protein [Candidatus Fermentibacteria bacterium]|nr:T9SS type A sorting domain-containing protein [Candidatus Fermentibacteria bacterium]